MLQEEVNDIFESQLLNEEYKIWKKNTPFLYDLVITYLLEWPSSTIEWLPIFEIGDDPDYKVNKLVMGTSASPSLITNPIPNSSNPNAIQPEQNYLLIAKVKIPKDDILLDISEYTYAHEKRTNHSAIGQSNGNIIIEKKILHQGEVQKARYMPQNPNVIASKITNGEIHLFNINKPYTNTVKPSPEYILTGHTSNGKALCWNIEKDGCLLSGALDGKILAWNIEGGSSQTGKISPSNEIVLTSERQSEKVHVNDVCWHKKNGNLFASCTNQGVVQHWDIRSTTKEIQKQMEFDCEVNTIDFHPQDANLYVTGSSDSQVVLWDMRKPTERLHTFVGHSDSVLKVEWGVNAPILASSSADKRIHIWDMAKINATQTAEEAVDGPPELLFVHAGHRGRVCDFNWNPNNAEDLLIASTEQETNNIHVWSMAKYIYDDQYYT